MPSDVPARLRSLADVYEFGIDNQDATLLREAADEIDRLSAPANPPPAVNGPAVPGQLELI